MQLFRTLLFMLHFAFFIISTNSNEITIKNYDVGFNKTYYGNITIKCKNQNACNMTTLYCDTGNCYIEAAGNNKGQLNNLIVDARNIRKGYKFELKCGSSYQSSTATNCLNVKVLCPLHRGATCRCTNCNYRAVKLYCEMGIGVYCSGGRVIHSWNQNNIWCDGGPFDPYSGGMMGGYGGGTGKYICDNVDWESSSCESTYTNPLSTYQYSFAPNDKCIAFQSSYYNTYYKEDITMITTHSCRETINATAREYKYHLPICVKYISKPEDIPELKQYFNITRIIIKNKTNIINQTNWIDQQRINWINKTRWINQTRIINKTVLIDRINWIDKELIRWINQTRIINKTVLIDRINWIDEIKIIIINQTNIGNRIRWINQTRIINKTNIINVKKIIEIIKWINRTRWFNRTKWFNKTIWVNKTIYINKTSYINKTRWVNKNNESLTIIKKESEIIKDKNENTTVFHLDFNNIFVFGGVSIGGLIILSMTFYIAWKCWLKEKIEDMVITYFIGEDGKSCLENIFFIKEYLDYLKEVKEERQDQREYYGLTPEQIAICKEAKAISKIKYEAALKVKWDEIAQRATRPNDIYHRTLFKHVIKPQRHSMIEMSELHNDIPTKDDDEEKSHIKEMEEGKHILYDIKPGTPRRRRKSVAI